MDSRSYLTPAQQQLLKQQQFEQQQLQQQQRQQQQQMQKQFQQQQLNLNQHLLEHNQKIQHNQQQQQQHSFPKPQQQPFTKPQHQPFTKPPPGTFSHPPPGTFSHPPSPTNHTPHPTPSPNIMGASSFSPLPAQSPSPIIHPTPSFPQPLPPLSPNLNSRPVSPNLNSRPPLSPNFSALPPLSPNLQGNNLKPQKGLTPNSTFTSSSNPPLSPNLGRGSMTRSQGPSPSPSSQPPSPLPTSSSTPTHRNNNITTPTRRRKSTVEYYQTSPSRHSPSRHSPTSLSTISTPTRHRKSSVDYYRIADQSSPLRSPSRHSASLIANSTLPNRKLSLGSSVLPSPIRTNSSPNSSPVRSTSPYLKQPPAFPAVPPANGRPRVDSLATPPPAPLTSPFSKSLPVTPSVDITPAPALPRPNPLPTSFSTSLPSTSPTPTPSPSPSPKPMSKTPTPISQPTSVKMTTPPPPSSSIKSPSLPTPTKSPPPLSTTTTNKSPLLPPAEKAEGRVRADSLQTPPPPPLSPESIPSTSPPLSATTKPPKPSNPPKPRASPLMSKNSSPLPSKPLPPASPSPAALRPPAPLPPASLSSKSSPRPAAQISLPSSPPPLITSLTNLESQHTDFALPPPRPAPPTTPAPLPPSSKPPTSPLPPASKPPTTRTTSSPSSPPPSLPPRAGSPTPPGVCVLPPGVVTSPTLRPVTSPTIRPLPQSPPSRPALPGSSASRASPPLPPRSSSPPNTSLSTNRPERFGRRHRRRSNSLFENSPNAPKKCPMPAPLPAQSKLTQRPTSTMHQRSPIESVATKESGFDLEKAGRLRMHTLTEVIQTEHAYIEHLSILSRVFIFPLKALGVLAPKESIQLFSNVNDLSFHHQAFVDRLESSMERQKSNAETDTVAIGQIFVSFMKDLKVYSKYATNHDQAQKLFEELKKNRKEFVNFLEVSQKDPACQGLSLDAFLIKPVQRLCKYPLFLRDLIKYTPPSHPDYQFLNEAFETVNTVVSAVNEEKREQEKAERMKMIADKFDMPEMLKEGRKLQMEGRLSVQKKGNREERILVLFNDYILVLKPKKDEKDAVDFSSLVASCELNKAILVNVGDSETEKFRFEVIFESTGIVFFAVSLEEKMVWVNEIRQCIKKFQIEFVKGLNKGKEQELSDRVKQWGDKGTVRAGRGDRKRLNALALSPRNTFRDRGMINESKAPPKRPSIFSNVFSHESQDDD